MDLIPVTLKESLDQAESGGEPCDAVRAREGPREVDGDAEVLGSEQEALRQLDDLRPVGIFTGLDSVADTLFRLPPGCFLEGEERKVVLKVRPAWG